MSRPIGDLIGMLGDAAGLAGFATTVVLWRESSDEVSGEALIASSGGDTKEAAMAILNARESPLPCFLVWDPRRARYRAFLSEHAAKRVAAGIDPVVSHVQEIVLEVPGPDDELDAADEPQVDPDDEATWRLVGGVVRLMDVAKALDRVRTVSRGTSSEDYARGMSAAVDLIRRALRIHVNALAPTDKLP